MELILGPILGAVSHNKAKVWIFWNQIKKGVKSVFDACRLFRCKEKCAQAITNGLPRCLVSHHEPRQAG